MRKITIWLAAGAAVSSFAAPVSLAAQEAPPPIVIASGADDDSEPSPSGSEEFDQTMAMLGSMFPAEPLTAEQQARLPQSQRIIDRMIPEGTMAEMMGPMFDQLLGPIMKLADASAKDAVSKGTGLPDYALDLDSEGAVEAALMFDPAYVERHEREGAILPALMREMVTVMEPTMRKAMSELYAIHFTQTELDGIEAFFQTEIGTSYARKSFALSSDPRIVSASMEAMPAIMGTIAAMEARLAEASDGLPAKRSFAELSPAEQARVAELTGYSVEEIAAEAASSQASDEAEGEAAESE